MTKKISKYLTINTILLFLFAVLSQPIYAEITITVSGNGEGSQNSVDVTIQDNQSVNVSNDSDITNDVSQDAVTGENSADSNTDGDVSIDTGDVETTVIVETISDTTDIDLEPCDCSDVVVEISDNGSGSENSISIDSTKTSQINVVQKAHVTNTVDTKASTGENTANRNNGSVSIITGDIVGQEFISNSVNVSDIDIATGNFQDIFISIFGNGADSKSHVDINLLDTITVAKLEEAYINNFLSNNSVTGGNSANSNLGAVLIGTGNITYLSAVVNNPINYNSVSTNCCDVSDPDVPQVSPPKPISPPVPPNENGGPSPGNGPNGNRDDGDDDGDGGVNGVGGRGGSVLGAFAGGSVLPATGIVVNPLLVLGLSLFFLISGLFVKLKARKKAFVYVESC